MALLAQRVCIGLVFSLMANSASGAEMKPDAINSAGPSLKALSNEKATPLGVVSRCFWIVRASPQARSTASSERTRRRHCAPMPRRSNRLARIP